jgi:hypothetical protein
VNLHAVLDDMAGSFTQFLLSFLSTPEVVRGLSETCKRMNRLVALRFVLAKFQVGNYWGSILGA